MALVAVALACGEGPSEPAPAGRTPGPYALRDISEALGLAGVGTRFNDQGDVMNVWGTFVSGGSAVAPPSTCGKLALNNRSHVLCTVSGAPGQPVPYVRNFAIWDGQALIPIAAADTFGTSIFYAWTLNDDDEIVGTFTYQPSFGSPTCAKYAACEAIFPRQGEPTFLPPMSYFGFSHMTDRFMVVQSTPCSGRTSFALFDRTIGQLRVLGACPGHASDMNAQGWVVGTGMADRFAPPDAMLYRPEGALRLGQGSAAGINDAGVVVGTVEGKAFMWKEGVMTPLAFAAADTNWTVTGALEINNRGQILAQADDSTHGQYGRSVILTPIAP